MIILQLKGLKETIQLHQVNFLAMQPVAINHFDLPAARCLWIFEFLLKGKNFTSLMSVEKNTDNHILRFGFTYLMVPNDERACNRSCSRASSAIPRT